MSMKNRWFILLVIALLFGLMGCKSDTQVYNGNDVLVGGIPADMCYDAEGAPIVYGVSVETTYIYIVYLNNEGDIVSRQYSDSQFSLGEDVQPRGSYYWSGGTCPENDGE